MAHLGELGLSVTGLTRQARPGMHQVADYADTPAADIVIHLAEEPDRAKVNRFGEPYADHAARVVEQLSRRAGRIIYASSGAVYGDESDAPFAPAICVVAIDAYSRSKIRNECIALDAGGTVVRLSNLYGKGMSENNVVSEIARQVPGTGPLRVRDDTPVRDFLWVTDAAKAIVMAVAQPCPGILNVGSGVGTSIKALAQIALNAVGEDDREIVAARPSSRRSVNVLDISGTQRRLGWTPGSSSTDQLGQFFRNGTSLDH